LAGKPPFRFQTLSFACSPTSFFASAATSSPVLVANSERPRSKIASASRLVDMLCTQTDSFRAQQTPRSSRSTSTSPSRTLSKRPSLRQPRQSVSLWRYRGITVVPPLTVSAPIDLVPAFRRDFGSLCTSDCSSRVIRLSCWSYPVLESPHPCGEKKFDEESKDAMSKAVQLLPPFAVPFSARGYMAGSNQAAYGIYGAVLALTPRVLCRRADALLVREGQLIAYKRIVGHVLRCVRTKRVWLHPVKYAPSGPRLSEAPSATQGDISSCSGRIPQLARLQAV
jgi:hypothetical protein